jgi:hypothetical protein
MAWLKQRGDPRRYWVKKDARCIGAECLALGLYKRPRFLCHSEGANALSGFDSGAF